jgi:3-phosphoinositide dependent protein kinase-1
MKVLSKAHIMREKTMDYVKVERDVMSLCRHPNIVRLVLTFQDPANLYYVTELAPHGDLQKVLNERGPLDPQSARVAAAQTLLAVAHMHQRRVLHRDLKPENLLIGQGYRVKITDFGTAKILDAASAFEVQRGSFVGSADYVSPEVLDNGVVGPSADLWALGCVVYALLAGVGPFHGGTQYDTFQRIQAFTYGFPGGFPADAEALVRGLLQLEPHSRLGHGEYDSDYGSIRGHPFFAGLDWAQVPEMEIPSVARAPPALEVPVPTIVPPTPVAAAPPAEAARPAVAAVAAAAVPAKPPPVEAAPTEVPHLLFAKERSLLEGMIVKKRGFSTKERRLVLTDRPRLFYVDMKARAYTLTCLQVRMIVDLTVPGRNVLKVA